MEQCLNDVLKQQDTFVKIPTGQIEHSQHENLLGSNKEHDKKDDKITCSTNITNNNNKMYLQTLGSHY